jgi:uncharacterized protein YndB with AHSA1/START domain
MAPITSHIEIARPPQDVFTYVTDPARFSEWQDDVVSASVEAGGQARVVGSRFTTTRRVGRTERVMTQEITECRPPSAWAARGVDGPVRPHVSLTIEPLAGNTGSRMTVVMDLEGHGIGRLLVPLLIRRQAARRAPRSYQHLKERLERRG